MGRVVGCGGRGRPLLSRETGGGNCSFSPLRSLYGSPWARGAGLGIVPSLSLPPRKGKDWGEPAPGTHGALHQGLQASMVAQTVKNLPAMQETQVQTLRWEDPLEKRRATHSNLLAWRIPWTEEPGGLYCPWGRKEWDPTE